MSLMDALLLDPFALDVWIAPRTDGVAGTGTESDPLDGSTQAKFDGAMLALPISVTGVSYSGTTVTVTAFDNGYSNGDLVLIAGATGPNGGPFNGIFSIFGINVATGQFSYTTTQPQGLPNGAITCRLAVSAGAMIPLPFNPPAAVHLGPGTLQTQGFAPGSTSSQTQWQPGAALKVFGSGMEVTVLQLVGASAPYEYAAIGCNYNDYLDSFEASDFTVDCNLAGQASSNVACGAIQVVGKHTRTRRIRVINFGTQTPGFECFPLTAGGAHPDNPECFDDIIEDCILEQPSINNVRETTCINIGGGERPTDGLTAYHRACVIRRCFLNCEYRVNPVPVSSISIAGVAATLKTSLPHGHVAGDVVRISGALVNGTANNSFNGSYSIASVIDGFTFTYNVATPAPTTNASGDMWVDRFSSQYLTIIGMTVASAGGNNYTVTLTTATPHFRIPGNNVVVSNVYDANSSTSPSPLYNGAFTVTSVTTPTVLQFIITSSTTPPSVTSVSSAFVGVPFQTLSADAGAAAIVELNRVLNARFGGPYHDTYNSRDVTVRMNLYRAVVTGPYQNLGGLSSSRALVSLTYDLETGVYVATASTSYAHGFVAGDAVKVTNATGQIYDYLNGVFTILSADQQTFKYNLAGNPNPPNNSGSSPTGDYARLWQCDRLVIESNEIELVPTPSNWGSPYGILVGYAISSSPPLVQESVMRHNWIRHLDGLSDPSGMTQATAMLIDGCEELISEENAIDLNSPTPLNFEYCTNTEFFANQSPEGALIPCYNLATNMSASELQTNIDDAVILAF